MKLHSLNDINKVYDFIHSIIQNQKSLCIINYEYIVHKINVLNKYILPEDDINKIKQKLSLTNIHNDITTINCNNII